MLKRVKIAIQVASLFLPPRSSLRRSGCISPLSPDGVSRQLIAVFVIGMAGMVLDPLPSGLMLLSNQFLNLPQIPVFYRLPGARFPVLLVQIKYITDLHEVAALKLKKNNQHVWILAHMNPSAFLEHVKNGNEFTLYGMTEDEFAKLPNIPGMRSRSRGRSSRPIRSSSPPPPFC